MEQNKRTRQDIENEDRELSAQIKQILKRRRELEIESMLLCDDEQWYTEGEEIWYKKEGRKKVPFSVMVGRVNWVDTFMDEDKDEPVSINRSDVVRIDGVWQ